MLKCEGTWRHACTVIPVTSTTQSAAKTTSSRRRVRPLSRSEADTQVMATSVEPKDSPKVTALRQDSGPAQGRGSAAATTRWVRPEAIRTAPTR